MNLLHAFSLFDGSAGKQLEEVAKHCDLFRSSGRLPVLGACLLFLEESWSMTTNEDSEAKKWYS